MAGSNQANSTYMRRIFITYEIVAIYDAIVSMTRYQGSFAFVEDIVSELVEIGFAGSCRCLRFRIP